MPKTGRGVPRARVSRPAAMDENVREFAAEVLQRCREGGHDACPTLAAYYVQASRRAKVDREALVAHCVARLAAVGDPALETLKTQIAVETRIADDLRAARLESDARDARAGALEREVAEATVDASALAGQPEKRLLDRLHRVAFAYVCVAAKMDKALTDDHERDEAYAALETVWSRHDLRAFFTQDPAARAEALRELASVVLGVRVYRRESDLAPSPLAYASLRNPVPEFLDAARELKRGLDAKLESAERLVGQYLVVIRHRSSRAIAEEKFKGGDFYADAANARLVDEHNNRRAYADALRRCADECARQTRAVEACWSAMEGEIEALREMVEAGGERGGAALGGGGGGDPDRTSRWRLEPAPFGAAPATEAFPRLDAIGALHLAIAEEVEAQARLVREVATLTAKRRAKPFETTLTNRMLHDASLQRKLADQRGVPMAPPTYESDRHIPDRVDAESLALAMAAKTGAEIEPPETEKETETGTGFADASRATLELDGYDAHALVKLGGLLRRAAPLPGYASDTPPHRVAFGGKHYGFADRDGALQFASQPEAYLARLERVVAARPELIHACVMTDVVSMAKLVEETASGRTRGGGGGEGGSRDFGAQTPTHFAERIWDSAYEWNEWALRRRALQHANLRRKLTRGAQTDASHFRTTIATQHWAPKTSAAQTAAQKGTAMPRKVRYVGGLRGNPEKAKMHVVDLDLDLGQPHEF